MFSNALQSVTSHLMFRIKDNISKSSSFWCIGGGCKYFMLPDLYKLLYTASSYKKELHLIYNLQIEGCNSIFSYNLFEKLTIFPTIQGIQPSWWKYPVYVWYVFNTQCNWLKLGLFLLWSLLIKVSCLFVVFFFYEFSWISYISKDFQIVCNHFFFQYTQPF